MFAYEAQTVIARAKDVATSLGERQLTLSAIAISIVMDQQGMQLLAEYLEIEPAELQRIFSPPEMLQQCPGKLALAQEVRDMLAVAKKLVNKAPIPSHPALIGLSHLTCAVAQSLPTVLFPGLQLPSDGEVFQLLVKWHEEAARPASLGQLTRRLRTLRRDLLDRVYGQEHAVHQFVEGLFNIEVVGSADTARRKPAGLFVFAGPPGGGKTYLAELGAACLEICPPNCRVRDIGTTNPAHVNGAPFTERDLGDGDILEVGYTQLQIALTAHVAVRTQPCPVCGKAIELLADEPDVDRCPDCAEQARRARRSAPKTTAVQCSTCGVDLTALGNSDGRAAELHEVAVYACKQCLPSGDDLAGVTIGEYEIRQRLGEGAMGAVYLVYHRPTARILALKQMKDLHDALLVRRFEREVRLLQSLVHSNIVRYINTGIDDKGAPYLVTEYVPGGSLEDTVAARGGRLPQDHAVRLMCQVLDGLEAMHTRAIIHRDIKPQNILLRHPAGAGDHVPTPKLADFGLAVSYERAGGTRVTKPGTGLGTLMFMPPEQMCNAGAVREPADIYAVGVTLYYLLTGQYSFNFPTPAEVAALQKKKPEQWKKPQEALRMLMQLRRIMHPFHIILSEEPIAIQQRNPAIPRQLDAVVDKAVRKEARERFQSAAAFRSALLQTLR